ncbi:MAG: membrane protein insertion efficiency factor YidD [Deltaproteobacteria bacterium]
MIQEWLVKFIRCYQVVAPSRLRDACRFTPSCSEYMILSLRRYGLFCGAMRGIYRVFRCRVPNGGVDFP